MCLFVKLFWVSCLVGLFIFTVGGLLWVDLLVCVLSLSLLCGWLCCCFGHGGLIWMLAVEVVAFVFVWFARCCLLGWLSEACVVGELTVRLGYTLCCYYLCLFAPFA